MSSNKSALSSLISAIKSVIPSSSSSTSPRLRKDGKDEEDPVDSSSVQPEHGDAESLTGTRPRSNSRTSTEVARDSLTTEDNYYDNYDTIDWIRDSTRDRRLRDTVDELISKSHWPKFIIYLTRIFYRVQAWIILSLIAVSCGILAASIAIPVDWLSDTRFGYCTQGFFLSARMCCQEYPTTASEPNLCEKWKTWGELFGLSRANGGAFVINYFMYIIAGVTYATIAGIFVSLFAPLAAGSGIAEVKTILGGFVIKDFASAKTLIVKCVGLILAVSSGLNVGKEGPLVHVALCTAEIFSRLFTKYSKNQAKKREVFSAAAAAGVSVAFGAPIGGVLFSLEEVSYYFPHKTMWRTFYCAALASIVLMYINPFHTGKLVIFAVTYSKPWLTFELIPFFFLSIAGGLIGVGFIKLNSRMNFHRKTTWLSKYPIREVMTIAAITAIFNYINPYLRGNTGSLIAELLADCDPEHPHDLCDPTQTGVTITYLLLATAIRFTLVIITFGIQVPAGVFIPPLAIGASLGRAVGIFVQYLQATYPDIPFFSECQRTAVCINPGLYALVGAAATLVGFTRITVSLVVIMFELTGELSFLVPIMMAVLVSKWTSDAFIKGGIYEAVIQLRQLPFLDNKTDYRFTTTADDVMTKNPYYLEIEGHNVGSLKKYIQQNKFNGFPVVNNKDDMFIVGYIAREELRHVLEQAISKDGLDDQSPCYFGVPVDKTIQESGVLYVDFLPYIDETPLEIAPSTPLNLVFDMFKKLGLRYILVSKRGVLLGVITKKDILSHIQSTQPPSKGFFGVKSPVSQRFNSVRTIDDVPMSPLIQRDKNGNDNGL